MPQLLGCRGSKLGLEGADLLLRVLVLLVGPIMLAEGLVSLLMSHAMLRAEHLHGLEQIIPLLAQLSDRRGIHTCPLL